MLPNRLLVIAQKVRYIGHRHPALEQNTREGMTEPVWSWTFVKLSRQFKYFPDLPPPQVSDGFKAVGPSDNKGASAIALCASVQAVAQPIRDIGEYVTAVLFRAEKDLVALEPVHMEQSHIGNP